MTKTSARGVVAGKQVLQESGWPHRSSSGSLWAPSVANERRGRVTTRCFNLPY